jgi:hypothetical protein
MFHKAKLGCSLYKRCPRPYLWQTPKELAGFLFPLSGIEKAQKADF